MKKLLILACILWLIFATPFSALAASFSDVPETHVNATAIQDLKDAGLVSGYPDGTFKPDQVVNRAEALGMIMRAAGITAQKNGSKMPFTDVNENNWFFAAVQTAVATGKIKGYSDKTFRPGNPITLPETLSMILNFFRVGIKNVTVEPIIYKGLDTKDWYAKHAQFAKTNNLIEPDARGVVDSAAPLTRGRLAEILFRMRAFQQTGKPFDITTKWVEITHLDNFWKLRAPADWAVFQGIKNSVIWKPAPGQIFFTRMWPESVRLSVSLLDNAENLTAAQFFATTKAQYQKNFQDIELRFSELSLGGRPALKIAREKHRTLDMAVALPNGKFLMMYGEYGEAAIGEFSKKQLSAMLTSYAYVEKPAEPPKPVIPLEERLQTLRENILVAEKWKEVAPLFPDKKLNHTDALGIGTGPVDYYFTKEADQTIKVERNSGTILNVHDGETDAF